MYDERQLPQGFTIHAELIKGLLHPWKIEGAHIMGAVTLHLRDEGTQTRRGHVAGNEGISVGCLSVVLGRNYHQLYSLCLCVSHDITGSGKIF